MRVPYYYSGHRLLPPPPSSAADTKREAGGISSFFFLPFSRPRNMRETHGRTRVAPSFFSPLPSPTKSGQTPPPLFCLNLQFFFFFPFPTFLGAGRRKLLTHKVEWKGGSGHVSSQIKQSDQIWDDRPETRQGSEKEEKRGGEKKEPYGI